MYNISGIPPTFSLEQADTLKNVNLLPLKVESLHASL